MAQIPEYHFARGIVPEPCSFGGHCPAEHHFLSESDAIAEYKKQHAIEWTFPEPPVEGMHVNGIARALEVIIASEDQPLGFRKEARDISQTDSLEHIGGVLLALARKGYLDGELITRSSIRCGEVREGAPELKWFEEIRRFGANVKFIATSLKVTESGRKLLAELNAAHELRNAARYRLGRFSRDGQELEALKNSLAELIDPSPNKKLPTVTELLRERAESMLKTDIGQPWTQAKISDSLGVSRQTASDLAQKLVAFGILEEDYLRDPFNLRYLKAYRVNRTVVELVGGLSKILGPKPE